MEFSLRCLNCIDSFDYVVYFILQRIMVFFLISSYSERHINWEVICLIFLELVLHILLNPGALTSWLFLQIQQEVNISPEIVIQRGMCFPAITSKVQ